MRRREIESHEKKIPTFQTDKDAQDFVDTADLTDYDLARACRCSSSSSRNPRI